jgi:uncharacterized protein (DUF1684 family)
MSELSEFRQGKDHFMGGEHDSPLTHEQAQSFQGLSYYDEEPALRFELDLERYEAEEIIEMQTSTGDAASYLRWGKVSFDVAGDSAQLTIYKDTDGDGYFLPFADGTSGDETYPPAGTWTCTCDRMASCRWTSTTRTILTAHTTRGGAAP